MAEMARDHHENIQILDKPDHYAKQMATSMVLEDCQAHLSEPQHNMINEELKADEIRTALKLSKNGSVSGLDGLPYEFYKWLTIRHEANNERLDIITFLTELYADIEKHGIQKGTDFNSGWMCPIYKKGDRTIISN
ncbi:hypothetical protein C8R45DRAFT_818204 [Mycena sanguinolenta]|nr:hypothetical protein C8R45DRAFT_818204 [Mycena sanguinolenta]